MAALLFIDAASYHFHWCSKLPWSMQKNATTWGGTVDWNLQFHLLKEFHWNYDVNQKATWQPNIKNHQCKYKVLCICIYIYTVFAIAVYLGSTYRLIYIYIHEVPTDTLNLYVSRCSWAKNFAIHTLRPPIKKNRATKSKQPRIELRINQPKTVHLPRTLIFHIWSKAEKEA